LSPSTAPDRLPHTLCRQRPRRLSANRLRLAFGHTLACADQFDLCAEGRGGPAGDGVEAGA
jgi:hypothetical protein